MQGTRRVSLNTVLLLSASPLPLLLLPRGPPTSAFADVSATPAVYGCRSTSFILVRLTHTHTHTRTHAHTHTHAHTA